MERFNEFSFITKIRKESQQMFSKIDLGVRRGFLIVLVKELEIHHCKEKQRERN